MAFCGARIVLTSVSANLEVALTSTTKTSTITPILIRTRPLGLVLPAPARPLAQLPQSIIKGTAIPLNNTPSLGDEIGGYFLQKKEKQLDILYISQNIDKA